MDVLQQPKKYPHLESGFDHYNAYLEEKVKEHRFINNEEKLFRLISRASSTFEEYETVIGSIENINYTDGNDISFLHQAVIYKKVI